LGLHLLLYPLRKPFMTPTLRKIFYPSRGNPLSISCPFSPRIAGIDPPYNTGNEGWVYNDNANSPLVKDWLGKEVGKDDLTRHDKWLCMMTPRLRLLRDLMANDGVIFVNIENNEQHHLRDLMDEIFGEDNLVGTLVWRKKEGGGQADQFFVTEHEYVHVYQKTALFKWMDEIIDVDEASFKKKDKDGSFNIVKLAKWGNTARREDRPKMYFPITAPDGKKVYPVAPDGSDGRWRVGQQRMSYLIENNLVYWEKKDGRWIAYEKIYYTDEMIKVIKERSILYDVANTADASKELTELFGKKDVFENPKPVELIKFFIQYTSDKESIILDSFSGSGTTGHTVMDLNKEDGGNRRFILVQMTEATKKAPDKNICKDITRERIKRAIEKYGYDSGFKYLRVGQPLDAETLLKGKLPEYKTFAKYVYYLCTGENLKEEKKINEKKFFIGVFGKQAIYLIYKQDYEALTRMALNLELAEKIIADQPDKKRIVYAPACFLDEEYMEANQIEFVSIPYNLFQRKTSYKDDKK
jgi:adenine-specific DNA-methyltransferase